MEAQPKTFGATWYTGLDYGGVIPRFDYREGDICLTSDPYAGHVATHTPDVHMWKPVFRGGKLVCFVGNHIHNTRRGRGRARHPVAHADGTTCAKRR